MYVIENPMPTLVLGRLTEPTSVDEARAVAREVLAVVVRNAPARTAILGDCRLDSVVPAAYVEVFLELMRADGPHLLCSGLLFKPNTAVAAQVVDLVRAAGNPEWRLATTDREELFRWYASRVTSGELRAIKYFVERADSLSAPP